MDRTSKFVLRKIVVDFVCLLVVGLAVLLFYLFGKPYERGFFCNDESLMHPFHESTVTSAMLYIVGLFLPIITMLVLEFNHSKSLTDSSSLVLLGYTVPNWMSMAYTKIGVFGMGALCTILTTDVAKYTIGRLRPHFMTLCRPSIDCSQPVNQHRYIENFTCTADGVSSRLLKEIRLSFPSGHSSFSAYTMVYLALYLQLRLTWKGSKLLKHCLQFICIMIAWFTALTRISNYKHHWSDVLAGSAIGTAIAVIMALGVADLFKERRRRQQDDCCHRHQQQQQQQRSHEEKSRAGAGDDYEVASALEGTQCEFCPLRSSSPNYGCVIVSAELGNVQRR